MVATTSDEAPATARTPLDDLAETEAALADLDDKLTWRGRLRRDPLLAEEVALLARAQGLLRAATTALLVTAAGCEVVAVQCARCGRRAPLGAMLGLPDDAGWRCRDRVACKAEQRRGAVGR